MGPAAWAAQTYTGHLPTTNPTSGKMAASAEADKGHEAQGRQEAERGTETDCCAWAWKESTSILLSDKKLAIK